MRLETKGEFFTERDFSHGEGFHIFTESREFAGEIGATTPDARFAETAKSPLNFLGP